MVNLYLHSHLLAEFDHEKNSSDPKDLRSMSKYWWKCSQGHSYEASFGKRKNSGRGCPYCAGRYVIPGENDIATLKPEIAHEFDELANGCLVSEITANSSSREVWWNCSDGHKWKSKPSHRRPKENTGNCPYCQGRWAIEGKNDVFAFAPELIEEICIEKLDRLKIDQITPTQKIPMYCREHRTYFKTSLEKRKRGLGCIYCSGQKAISGVNDLATLYPEIASDWDTKKNAVSSGDVFPHTDKKYWWRCSLGHSYEMGTKPRTRRGQGCQYCATRGGGRKLLSGFNDFATLAPEVAKEWNYSGNSVFPSEVFMNSQLVVSWTCSTCSRDWDAKVENRSSGGGNCPNCSYRSKPERDIAMLVEEFLGKRAMSNDRKVIAPFEIDIYIPELMKGIEFNGTYWHSDKFLMKTKGVLSQEYHDMKSNMSAKAGVALLHVHEIDWDNDKERMIRLIKEFLRTPNEWMIFDTST